jgi:acyl-CoA thioesterase FadM
MNPPFVPLHRVRFDEVDGAGIVYFARFFSLCSGFGFRPRLS